MKPTAELRAAERIDRGRGGKELYDRQLAGLKADIIASLYRNRFDERSNTHSFLLAELMLGTLRGYEAVGSMREVAGDLDAEINPEIAA